MTNQNPQSAALKPAGDTDLIDRCGLEEVIPNWHRSLVAPGNTHRVATVDAMVEETCPAGYWPGESLGDHLEFALKYDGTNLGILARVATPDGTSAQ